MYWLRQKGKIWQKIISSGLVFILLFSLALPQEALAARSRAGGGDIKKFGWGDFGKTVGISMGMAAIAAGLNVSMQSSAQAMNLKPLVDVSKLTGLDKLGGTILNTGKGVFVDMPLSLGHMATNPGTIVSGFQETMQVGNLLAGYNNFVAVSQVGRAVGMMGSYYKWSPKTTFIVSSVASNATGGFLNPAPVLRGAMTRTIYKEVAAGSSIYYMPTAVERLSPIVLGNMLKGAAVAGATGWVNSAVIASIDMDKIKKGESPGMRAQIYGMVAGMATANLGEALVNPETFRQRTEKVLATQPNPEIAKLNSQAYDLKEKARTEVQNAVKAGVDKLDQAWDNLTQGDMRGAFSQAKSAVIDDGSKVWDKMVSAQAVTDAANKLSNQAAQLASAEPAITREVIGVNRMTGKLTYGEIIPVERLPQVLNGRRPNVYTAYDNSQITALSRYNPNGLSFSDVSKNLLEAALVETGQMWPDVAARALGIAAAESLGKKYQGMSDLVVYLVEGVASPAISGFADMYALRPGLYWGQDRLMRSIQYRDAMIQLPMQDYLAKKGEPLHKAYTKWWDETPLPKDAAKGAKLTPEERWAKLTDDERDGLIKILQKELQTKLNDLKITYRGETIELKLINNKEDLKQFTRNFASTHNWGEKRLKDEENRIDEVFRDAAQANLSAPRLLWGQAQAYLRANAVDSVMYKQVPSEKNGWQGTLNTFDEACKAAGTSRIALYLNNARNEANFGAVEGAMSGGALSTQWSKNDSAQGLVTAYGATLLSGYMRGVTLYNTWQPSTNERGDVIWSQGWEIYQPEPFTLDEEVRRAAAIQKEKAAISGVNAAKEIGEAYRGMLAGDWQVVRNSLKSAGSYGRDALIAMAQGIKDTKEANKLLMPGIAQHFNYYREMEEIKEFAKDSGLRSVERPIPRYEKVYDPITGSKWVKQQDTSSISGYELTFGEERPEFSEAISASLKRANTQFISRAFAFGAPRIDKPEYISALNTLDYLSALNNYALAGTQRNWLTGVTSGGIRAAAATMSENTLTSMAALKPSAQTSVFLSPLRLVNIQPMRLTSTNSPTTPFTIQASDYQPWKLGFDIRFWLPWYTSNSFRGARSGSGRSYLSRDDQ